MGLKIQGYYLEWKAGHMEVRDGILYHWEQTKTKLIRQLHCQVVPRALQQLTVWHIMLYLWQAKMAWRSRDSSWAAES